jgi:type IV secretory pathway VirJ component
MNRLQRKLSLLLLAAIALSLATSAASAAPARSKKKKKASPAAAATGPGPGAETLKYGRFGDVYTYRKTPHPQHVVLFLSGDGGWNLGVVDMARTLSDLDALIVGINLPRYMKALAASPEACLYPAADLELLSKYVQKKLGFPSYVPPVLVGYSSGATLAYAALVQAPPNTFRGAISMGFCPDLPLTRPLCAGHGLTWGPGPKGKGYSFKPATSLEQPWVAFQGDVDQVCFPKDVEEYVKQTRNGEIVMLPKVGHGFSVPAHWEPQFKQAFQRLTAGTPPGVPGSPGAAAAPPGMAGTAAAGPGQPAAEKPGASPLPRENPAAAPAHPPAPPGSPPPAADAAAPARGTPVADLPLVEVPPRSPGSVLAVILSGDGGWAGLDKEVAQDLSAKGVPVVGLNCLQYFWNARTPVSAAADLARILRHYLTAWNRQQAILVGYSLGAEVLPFLVTRLPADLQARIRLIALLAPGRQASFEFHLSDWLGGGGGGLPVLPELAKLRGKPILCMYGDAETDSLCTEIGSLGKAIKFHGSHHLGGDYGTVAERILQEVQPAR